MSQTSRDMTLRRIEDGLAKLAQAIRGLPSSATTANAHANTAGAVSREAHEALLTAHDLLRTRAEAAIQGIDRLIGKGGSG